MKFTQLSHVQRKTLIRAQETPDGYLIDPETNTRTVAAMINQGLATRAETRGEHQGHFLTGTGEIARRQAQYVDNGMSEHMCSACTHTAVFVLSYNERRSTKEKSCAVHVGSLLEAALRSGSGHSVNVQAAKPPKEERRSTLRSIYITATMRAAAYWALRTGLEEGHEPFLIYVDDAKRRVGNATKKALHSRGFAVPDGEGRFFLTELGRDLAAEEWERVHGLRPPTPLYHRTSPEAAHALAQGAPWTPDPRANGPDADYVWFSDRRNGSAEGYGDGVVRVLLHVEEAWLDDEYPDGECHYRVPLKELKGVRRILG